MEPNFSMGCIIGEKGNDLEFDPQINSLQEDLKEILSEEKIKEGQTSTENFSGPLNDCYRWFATNLQGHR